MRISVSFLFLGSSYLLSSCGAYAFVQSAARPRVKNRLSRARLFLSQKDLDDTDDEHQFDMDAARRELECLVGVTGHPFREENDFATNPWHSSTQVPESTSIDSYDLIHAPMKVDLELPSPPPLTTIERERRDMEIRLLTDLAKGDEALTDLWNHWFQERGPKAAARLWKTEEMIAEGPHRYNDAERILRRLLDDFGVHWVEPISRLATLHLMQGRLKEAEELYMIVLAVKPWHIGGLSGIVMALAGQKKNQDATTWAARRLPAFTPGGHNHRRIIWSQKAAKAAQDALFDAEERLKDLYGAPDAHDSILRCRGIFVPENEIGFWQ